MASPINELSVIVAGHLGTGTSSLKVALEKLYGHKCYELNDMITNHADHIEMWTNAFDHRSVDKELCDKVFPGYCSVVGYPASLFYKDLMNIYPRAKVILTNKNSDRWLKSMKNEYVTTSKLCNNPNSQTFLQKMYSHAFRIVVNDKLPSDEHARKCLEKFDNDVKNTVAEGKLLEFNIADGWEPLCKFLNLPEPSSPFPFVKNEGPSKGRSWIFTSLTVGSIVVCVLAFSLVLIRRYPS